MNAVRLVKCNLLGCPVGEDSPTALYADALVLEAKALRMRGVTYKAIAAELGPNYRTIWDWCNGKRRPDPTRVIARRVKPGSFKVDHQQASANPAAMRVVGHDASVDTVRNTVKNENER